MPEVRLPLFATLAAVGVAWLLVPRLGQAQEAPLEEVIVTAALRATPLDRLPASASVLDSAVLKGAGVQHLEDVLGLVPNLNWAGGASRPRYFQLRGIGELEQYQGAPNPSIGFLIDDMDFSGIGMPATLFDVSQVEVLRGPQGTTYGANALAGLISVRTRDPQEPPELRTEATVGEYDTRAMGVALGSGLGGGARAGAWRLAAHHYRSDGFRRNLYLRRDDTGGFDEQIVRGKLRLAPGPDLQLQMTAMLADIDNGYDAWSIDNSRLTQSDAPGRDAQRSRALALRLDYTGFAWFDLRALASVAQSDTVFSFDGDWGNDVFWGTNGPYAYTSRIQRDRHTTSGELRAMSRNIAEQWSWIAGLYALRLAEALGQVDHFNGAVFTLLNSDFAATNVAAYAALEVPLVSRLRLSLGLRGERRDARYEDSNLLREQPVDTMLGGNAALTWQHDPRHSYYASLSRGYKAGGFNIGTQVPAQRRQYAPELLWNLELGTHARSADGRLRAQAALFYMRRIDQQVYTSFQADPNDPLTFVLLTDNARGENYGLEGQLQWQLTAHWELSAGLAALQTRYIGFEFGGLELDGREQAHAPQYQYSLGVEYRAARGWFARLDVQASDDFYLDASNNERASAFRLVNTRLGYEAGHWHLSLWARNLLDAAHPVRGFFFGNEPPDFAPRRYLQAGEPRRFGLTVELTF